MNEVRKVKVYVDKSIFCNGYINIKKSG